RDLSIGAVVVDEEVEQVERLLDREVLPRMVERVEHDLRLGLVGRDVVADLRHPDVATLVALADAEDVDDVRMGRFDGVDLADHLDRKSTRLNSSHEWISYAVLSLTKKTATH